MSTEMPNPAMLQSAFGEEIRRLRHEQDMTLEEVSAKSGISIGSLSQIERGKGNPAFFTLFKMAHALDVPVARLLHVERTASPLVRRGEGRALSPHVIEHPGAMAEMLTPDLDRSLQVVRYTIPNGARIDGEPFAHSGEEFITVLSGRCGVTVNGVDYLLEEGDSLSFDSALPHGYANPGTEPAVLIFVCTPPTF